MNQSYTVLTGNPLNMGAMVTKDGVNFAVRVPEDREAFLVLTDPSGSTILQEIPLPVEDRVGEVSAVLVRGRGLMSCGYYFVINGKKVDDPYAKRVSGPVGRIVSDRYDWENVASPKTAVNDLIIYKLHVRGFTKGARSGVKAKGTFRGIVEKIPYLKELGINAIELMPAYEWDETLDMPPFARITAGELRNYWGYAEKNRYYAPKEKFSRNADSVREMKDMVKALHRAGISCIMEFYIPAEADTYAILQAVRYWKMAYHIDGFHFSGEGVPYTPITHDPLLARTLLFFERLDERNLPEANSHEARHLIEYNNDFQYTGRCFLKGDAGLISRFVSAVRKNPASYGTVNYLANVNGFTLMDAVSYNEKHNEENGENNCDGTDMNLSWNCGEEGPTRRKLILDLRRKQVRNALAYVLLSESIPLIYAGDEFGNSQDGNNNPYASDDPLGWVDWTVFRKNEDIFRCARDLIAFRKEHPILHPEKALRGTDYRSFGFPDVSIHCDRAWYFPYEEKARSVALMYCGSYARKADGSYDDLIYVAYNAYWEKQVFGLPILPRGRRWQVVLSSDKDIWRIFDEEPEPSKREEATEALPVPSGAFSGTVVTRPSALNPKTSAAALPAEPNRRKSCMLPPRCVAVLVAVKDAEK